MSLEYFETKKPDSFFIKSFVDSYKPAYRVFIEKRKTAIDHGDSQGLFVLVPNGFKDSSVQTSLTSPGSATLTLLTNTLTSYFRFDDGSDTKLDEKLYLKNRLAAGTAGTSGLEMKSAGTPNTTDFIYDYDLLKYKQKQIETALKQEEQNRFLKSGFILPNRDPSREESILLGDIKKNNPLLYSLITETVLSEETKLQMVGLNTFLEEIDSGDLIFIDTYSHRKQKLLPAFTGVITRKSISGGVNDHETLSLSIEDYSYFLSRSQYIISPAVYDRAQRQTIEGTNPGTESDKKDAASSNSGFESQITAFQTNLMNKSAFEIFLALFLCSKATDNPYDLLDDQGRILSHVRVGPKVEKYYSILPLRSPLLSRIERILAYPFTKRIDTAWSFLQGTAKSRQDLLQEVVRHLECEYFFSEEGEPVIKFPTRLDAFSFLPPVNLLPANNLGRTRIHDKSLVKAKAETKPKAGQPEALYLNQTTDIVLGDPDDKDSSSYQIEKQLIISSEYLTIDVTTENTVKASERISKIRFQKYQKRNHENSLYIDPRSEYLTLKDTESVARSKNLNLQDESLGLKFGPGSTASGSLSAGLSGTVNIAPAGAPPQFRTVNNAQIERSRLLDIKQKSNVLSREAAKGGEIPTLYPDELISWSWEDNVEELFTAGFIAIDQHYIQPQGTDQQTLMMTGHGAFFVDVLNSQKYGYNYKDLNPQFFRDPLYASLYVYNKLNMVSQERYRGSVTAIDDPFIRRGMPVKIFQRRNLKVRKYVPAKKISLYDAEALKKVFGLMKGKSLNDAMRFNIPEKDGLIEGEILFEEREIFLPCIYYVSDVSRTYPVGDATPTMTLTLTAGRAEFNSDEILREGEDQWSRGFFYFYHTFLFAPKDNPDPIKDKKKETPTPPPPTKKPDTGQGKGTGEGTKPVPTPLPPPETKKVPPPVTKVPPTKPRSTQTTTAENGQNRYFIHKALDIAFDQSRGASFSKYNAMTSSEIFDLAEGFTYSGAYNSLFHSTKEVVTDLLIKAIGGYIPAIFREKNIIEDKKKQDALCRMITNRQFWKTLYDTPESTRNTRIGNVSTQQFTFTMETLYPPSQNKDNEKIDKGYPYFSLNAKEKIKLRNVAVEAINISAARILSERVVSQS